MEALPRPHRGELLTLLGPDLGDLWRTAYQTLMDTYRVTVLWDRGGDSGLYSCRFRISGRAFCTINLGAGSLSALVVLGAGERQAFEGQRSAFALSTQTLFDGAKAFHDGTWLFVPVRQMDDWNQVMALLALKNAPRRVLTRCGYCCDLCQAYVRNIRKQDRRAALSAAWKKYYDLEIAPETMICDGCACNRKDARRIDAGCPVRVCAMERGIQHCGLCDDFPCDMARQRRGLDEDTARKEQGDAFDEDEFYTYLEAFDNFSRLERKRKQAPGS